MRLAINKCLQSFGQCTALVLLFLLVFTVSGVVTSGVLWVVKPSLLNEIWFVAVLVSTAVSLPLLWHFFSIIQNLEASGDRLKIVRDELSDRIEELDIMTDRLEQARADLEQQVLHRTRELEAARSAAEDAIRARSAFFTSMSHELRTPLNAIIGFSNLMSDPRFLAKSGQNESVGEYAEIIYNSGQRLLDIVSDLVTLSNIDSGKTDLRIERIDLPPFIQKVEAAILSGVKEREQTLICLLDPAAGSVAADRVALHRILMNLLGNASRYSPAETTILLSITGAGDHVAFTVRDEGKGMVPAEIRSAIEPFSRLSQDDAVTTNTVGLGLYIATGLVEAQGGTLTLTSEPGKGTEARVVLPHRIAAATPSNGRRRFRDAVA